MSQETPEVEEFYKLSLLAQRYIPEVKISCKDIKIPRLREILLKSSDLSPKDLEEPIEGFNLFPGPRHPGKIIPTSSENLDYTLISYSSYASTQEGRHDPKLAKRVLDRRFGVATPWKGSSEVYGNFLKDLEKLEEELSWGDPYDPFSPYACDRFDLAFKALKFSPMTEELFSYAKILLNKLHMSEELEAIRYSSMPDTSLGTLLKKAFHKGEDSYFNLLLEYLPESFLSEDQDDLYDDFIGTINLFSVNLLLKFPLIEKEAKSSLKNLGKLLEKGLKINEDFETNLNEIFRILEHYKDLAPLLPLYKSRLLIEDCPSLGD